MSDEVEPGDTIALHADVEALDDEHRACDYCSTLPDHEAHIAERGIIAADYRLTNPYGVTMAFSCHTCIADAPEYDHY